MEFGKALLIYIMGIISGLSIIPAVVFTQGLRLKQAKEPAVKPAAPAAPAALAAPATTLGMKELAEIWLHLDAPSKLPYALDKFEPGSGKYNGQAGQDKWVDNVFKGRKNLFVVESGALNGVSHSNSIFFETERQWDCLLVEANPYLWPEVRSKHRKCHFLTAGLSITKEKGDFPFKLAGPLGGFTETMVKSHVKRADSEIKRSAVWMKGKQGDGEVIRVSAFPLYQAGGQNWFSMLIRLRPLSCQVHPSRCCLRWIAKALTIGALTRKEANLQYCRAPDWNISNWEFSQWSITTRCPRGESDFRLLLCFSPRIE